MKVIVYTTHYSSDNSVAICTPAVQEDILEVQKRDTPSHSIIMDTSELPNEDNDFFDCWELHDGKVIVNLDKAKAQTKGRLRYEREPLFAPLDTKFIRALEDGEDTAPIVAEKKRLRNITLLPDTCTTTAELRALTCLSQ